MMSLRQYQEIPLFYFLIHGEPTQPTLVLAKMDKGNPTSKAHRAYHFRM